MRSEKGSLDDIVRGIEKWVFDNDMETKNPNATLREISEALNMLKRSVYDVNRQDTMLGIGSVVVLLIILGKQHGLPFEVCLESTSDVMKDALKDQEL